MLIEDAGQNDILHESLEIAGAHVKSHWYALKLKDAEFGSECCKRSRLGGDVSLPVTTSEV